MKTDHVQTAIDAISKAILAELAGAQSMERAIASATLSDYDRHGEEEARSKLFVEARIHHLRNVDVLRKVREQLEGLTQTYV